METLQLRKATLGRDHPATLATMHNLALAYQAVGKRDLALPLFEDTLTRRRATLGHEHPNTLQTMSKFAGAYQAGGKSDLALPLYVEALRLQKAKLGHDHADTLKTMKDLAAAYQAAGNGELAVPLHKDLLVTDRKTLRKDSLQLAKRLATLGLLLLSAKAFAEAEPILRECLAIREAKEPSGTFTFNAKSMLGGALIGQKKYVEAERLLLAAYQGIRRPGTTRSETLDRLIELYTAMDKPDEVKRWQAERANYPAVIPPPREKE
jgi:tetratricopeptide (TPR) repeat protein